MPQVRTLSHAETLYDMDPEHTSCIGGQTVLTCRDCAGNAPRGSTCSCCSGRGFNIFICPHCHPAAAAAAAGSPTTSPESSAPASPASLSRSSSTVSSRHGSNQMATWKRFGDGNGGSGGGSLGSKASSSRGL
ncbi:hypothetical protein BO70DRAFT_431114 [Aspergillus heteromorphus CBS 117.55]|uniref:Uncharacterized protein n=1 Tax=Aspergillus heteromorphus CBS 117.55 TaxID=1448321 RepID=A0A317VLC4_9EURO|nr:uncharacterized protein BO70DRAFT_431114 [Aspergillus heteromorphus CBS 117.55]PWY75136.1 hypothetical protein BO70DRAFT_431114 [Aspergillus heteromorphus CBS 117.55]